MYDTAFTERYCWRFQKLGGRMCQPSERVQVVKYWLLLYALRLGVVCRDAGPLRDSWGPEAFDESCTYLRITLDTYYWFLP